MDHAQDGLEDASHGCDLVARLIVCGRQRIIVPEQLVGAVYQMDFHSDKITKPGALVSVQDPIVQGFVRAAACAPNPLPAVSAVASLRTITCETTFSSSCFLSRRAF